MTDTTTYSLQVGKFWVKNAWLSLSQIMLTKDAQEAEHFSTREGAKAAGDFIAEMGLTVTLIESRMSVVQMFDLPETEPEPVF